MNLPSIVHSRLQRRRLAAGLGPGKLAIDCGANVGTISELMARTGAEVHAFEPNPYAFAQLRERVAKWKNVHCYQKAVLADDRTRVRLFLHEYHDQDPVRWSTGSSIFAAKTNVGNRALDVEAVNLVAFIKSLDRPVDVLKMDIEGAEGAILEKLLDEGLYRQIRTIFVETHERIPGLEEPIGRIRRRIASMGLQNIDLEWD